jgi:hypothetical protein
VCSYCGDTATGQGRHIHLQRYSGKTCDAGRLGTLIVVLTVETRRMCVYVHYTLVLVFVGCVETRIWNICINIPQNQCPTTVYVDTVDTSISGVHYITTALRLD